MGTHIHIVLHYRESVMSDLLFSCFFYRCFRRHLQRPRDLFEPEAKGKGKCTLPHAFHLDLVLIKGLI